MAKKIALSKLFGLSLTDSEKQMVGVLGQPYINPENGQVIAFWADWNSGIVPVDIKEIHKDHIEIQGEEAILPLQDFWRLQQWGYARTRWLGKAVYSKSGQKMGHVDDIELDSDLTHVLAIHCSKRFLIWTWNERIFARMHVSEVTERGIFLAVDPEESQRQKAPVNASNSNPVEIRA